MSRRPTAVAHLAALRRDLAPRDLSILDSVQRLRLLRSDHIERLHFGNLSDSSRGRRRRTVLSRLARLDLLSTLERRIGGVRAGSAGYIYSLGLAGQRLLDLDNAEPARRARRVADPSWHFIDHRLAISELLVQLFEVGLRGEVQVLEGVAEPDCWRQINAAPEPVSLRPDAFMDVAVGEFAQAWFVEIDLGTERSPALVRKADVYRTAWQAASSGETFPQVLWLVPDGGRRSFVARALRQSAGPPELHRVEINPSGPTELSALLLAPINKQQNGEQP